jgi:hypothetical protein
MQPNIMLLKASSCRGLTLLDSVIYMTRGISFSTALCVSYTTISSSSRRNRSLSHDARVVVESCDLKRVTSLVITVWLQYVLGLDLGS